MDPKAPRVASRRRLAIQRALIAWFDRSARVLPWRTQTSPYRTWVAEIMAQQTRLDTVVPYFERFMARFPDLAALAGADLDEVLALWSGLGYYSRGRHLHEAARIVALTHGGRLPSDPVALQGLPGIGRYTAGAIASIAFGLPAPIVDGNVLRVLSRVFDLEGDTASPAVREALWGLAAELVPPRDPGKFNEALMELGALVCTPQGPDCGACPLTHSCLARRRGSQAERPVVTPKRPPRPVLVRVAYIRRPGRGLLLVKNPPRGLFGGLWACPLHLQEARRSARSGDDLASALHRDLGLRAEVGPRLAAFEHILTHRRLQVVIHGCQLAPGRLAPAGYQAARWILRPDQFARLGLARLTRRILERVGDPLA